MTKFNVGNVGDKVRILDGQALLGNRTNRVTTGKLYEILSFHEKKGTATEYIKVATNDFGTFNICDYEYKYIELVEKKLTKNQRLTAIENELSETKNEVAELKLIVHELRDKKVTTTATVFMGGVPVDLSNVPEIQLKAAPTPNQQRAAIIEKAKRFVDELVKRGADKDAKTFEKIGNETYQRKFYIVEFKNKPNKVTALVKRANPLGVAQDVNPRHIGSAICSSNDVFNEHIGKAIALGRALDLDVSEFEQAVQPTKKVIGTIVKYEEYLVEMVGTDYYDALYTKGTAQLGSAICQKGVIINDTNAKYEVSSNE